MKTKLVLNQDLNGVALDWAVAVAEGKAADCEIHAKNIWYGRVTSGFMQYRPSTDWKQAGPIIERERLCLHIGHDGVWLACIRQNYDDEAEHMVAADTPLIAAMRCYVKSRLGDEVEIPEELI